MSNWLAANAGNDGSESILVREFSDRLVELARRRLPQYVRQRIDPEDIVQSVYRSFFRRLSGGQFELEDSLDVWRLLAAMTYHKAIKAIRFHTQLRRDARRDAPLDTSTPHEPALRDLSPGPEHVATLLDFAHKLCTRLPEHHRSVFLLRLEGYSVEEIAKRVNRSQGTVLRVLARVRELAAKELEVVA